MFKEMFNRSSASSFSLPAPRQLCAAIALGSALLVGCGSGSSASAGDPSPTSSAAKVPESAKEIGDAIGDVYQRAMVATADLLGDKPPAAEVSPRLLELREQWIAELIVLGRQVERLDSGGQATVRGQVASMYSGLQRDPEQSKQWTAFSKAINAYNGSDPEFAKELRPLNILTQYAFFDLLRKQAPKEAERLGLSAPATP